MTEKVCRVCGVPKPLDGGFHRNRSRPDGHSDECKPCKLAYQRGKDAGHRSAIARRQTLFAAGRTKPRERKPVPLDPKSWWRIDDPTKREAARLEYERLLAPPPLPWELRA